MLKDASSRLVVPVFRSVAIGTWVGLFAGLASAAFLISLEWATATREGSPWLLFLLPLGGLAVGGLYHALGRSVERGNNLLLDRIHDPEGDLPVRMAPLVFLGTVVTHLFGGSAGREGTAVQMGGSLGRAVTSMLRLSAPERRLVLMAGIAGGFGSVFGTPLAGAVFGMEVLTVGQVSYAGLIPCLTASIVGDLACRACGVHHHTYPVHGVPSLGGVSVLWVILVGLLSGLVSRGFVGATEGVSSLARHWIRLPYLRPVVGGLAVIGLTLLVGTRDYLGLSLPMIDRAFTPGGVVPYACLLKLLFTAVTLGTGFKGGEVTPLFGIGATLGSAVAAATGMPHDGLAALGFVAVFGAAANTPLACVLMGIELFGAPMAAPLAVACGLAYVVSGHRGIYHAQKVEVRKREEPERSIRR